MGGSLRPWQRSWRRWHSQSQQLPLQMGNPPLFWATSVGKSSGLHQLTKGLQLSDYGDYAVACKGWFQKARRRQVAERR